jgi:hypothetical protein
LALDPDYSGSGGYCGNRFHASLDGKMIDKPHPKLAQRVLAQANTAGLA